MQKIALLIPFFFFPGVSWSQGQSSSARDNSIAVNADNNSTVIIHQHLADQKIEERNNVIRDLQGKIRQQQGFIDWLQDNPIQTLIKRSEEKIAESLPAEEKKAFLSGNPTPAIIHLEKKQKEAETAARLTSVAAARYAFETALLLLKSNQQRALIKTEEAIALNPDELEYHFLLVLQIYSDVDQIETHPSWRKLANKLSSDNIPLDPWIASGFYFIEIFHYAAKGQFSAALKSASAGKLALGTSSNKDHSRIALEGEIIFSLFEALILAIPNESESKSYTDEIEVKLQQLEARLNRGCGDCYTVWALLARFRLLTAGWALDTGDIQRSLDLSTKAANIARQLSALSDFESEGALLLNRAYLLQSQVELTRGNIKLAKATAKRVLESARAGGGKRSRGDLQFILEIIEHALKIERNGEGSQIEIDFYKEIAKEEVGKLRDITGDLGRAEINFQLSNILFYADDGPGRLQALSLAEKLIKDSHFKSKSLDAFYVQKKIRYAMLRTSLASIPTRSQEIIDSWRKSSEAFEAAMAPRKVDPIDKADLLFEQIRHNGIHVSCKSIDALLEQQRAILSTEWNRSTGKSSSAIASRFEESFNFELSCAKDAKALEVAERRFAYAQVDYFGGNNYPEHHVFSAHSEVLKQLILNNKSERLMDHAEVLWKIAQNCNHDQTYIARCLEKQGGAYTQLASISEDLTLSSEYFSLAYKRLESAIQIGREGGQFDFVDSARMTLISALTIEALQYPKKINHEQVINLYQKALSIFTQITPRKITKSMESWKIDLQNWIKSEDKRPFSIEPWNYYGQTVISLQK